MTPDTVALVLMAAFSMVVSMAALLGVVVLHHRQNTTYDDSICSGCSTVGTEVQRLAEALSFMWRHMEAADGGGPEMSGTILHDDQVGVRH